MMVCIILFRSLINFRTFLICVRESCTFDLFFRPSSSSSSCSSSSSSSGKSSRVSFDMRASAPSSSSPCSFLAGSSLFESPSSVSAEGFSSAFASFSSPTFASCSFCSASAFFFHRPRPRPGPRTFPSMSSVRSLSFLSIKVGVTKSGITFCQKSGSSMSSSLDPDSAENFDLLTVIPDLLSQLEVLGPSTTRVRDRLARMVSMSSAQN
mmetsp:Transcript_18571/g.35313  ORF Transcript_18571/g.35313 Transcript_18571/m.35313 type:complete len:209 (-) Transcript_18571:462-1088(-)